jgi:hypothetical protein
MAKRGRKTKYNKKYCDEIIEYFDVPPQNTAYKEEYFNDGSLKSKVPVITATEIPTFQGFANKIGVNIDTLHEWKEVYSEFSEAYTRAKQIQEKIWLVNAMSGLYNAQFAQFFGKNCLGYKDKVETVNKNIELSYEDYIKKVEDADEY